MIPAGTEGVGISLAQFAALYPKVGSSIQERYCHAFTFACAEFEINTLVRLAAFHAQVAHESAGLRFLEELGGPIYFRKYDPGTPKGKELGNVTPGDGERFKGRGPIQLTGKNNYREFGEALNLPLLTQPELALDINVGARIAGRFWKTRGCNELADFHDGEHFMAITKHINGGYNGLLERTKRWDYAKKVLGIA